MKLHNRKEFELWNMEWRIRVRKLIEKCVWQMEGHMLDIQPLGLDPRA